MPIHLRGVGDPDMEEAPTLLQVLTEPESSEPTLVVEASGTHKILLANAAWYSLTGYQPEDVIGSSSNILHGPLTCKETVSTLSMAMHSTCRSSRRSRRRWPWEPRPAFLPLATLPEMQSRAAALLDFPML